MLRKKIQDLEQTQLQTDDVIASTKSQEHLKDDLEKLQKKYSMTRRLFNLRNDDIASLKSDVTALKKATTEMQWQLQGKIKDLEPMKKWYSQIKQLWIFRTNKLNEWRSKYGEELLVIDETQTPSQ